MFLCMQRLHILYEHPTWFQGLFRHLDRRGIDYQKLDLSQNQLDPLSFPGDAVLFNRVGARPSKNAETVVRDLKEFLAVLELRGVEVINGSRSYDIATSKLRQQTIFESLGLSVPQTVVTRECNSVEGLPFPVLVKPNVGGSGEGMRIIETSEEFPLKFEELSLLQEYLLPDDGFIYRVEIIGDELLYGLKLPFERGRFNYCPADSCSVGGAQKSTFFTPDSSAIEEAIRALRCSDSEIGSVEYLYHQGKRIYYDLNPLSNFTPEASTFLGKDPNEILLNYLLGRSSE